MAEKNIQINSVRRMSFWEKLYLPEIARGLGLTLKQMFQPKFTRMYPEERFEPVVEYSAGKLHIGLESPGRVSVRRSQASELDLALGPDVALALDLQFGAAQADLELGGLNFVGVVDSVVNGQVIKVLKFTTSDMKIRDLVQSADASPGYKIVTAARAGSTSTVNRTKVPGQPEPPPLIQLFTVQLKGNLDILGIKIPVDYTAAHPPPLNVPFATFTEVTVRNTDLIGGNLTIPGARISVVSDQAPVDRR